MARCDSLTTQGDRADVLNKFLGKMALSGYNSEVRSTIMEAGLRGYARMMLDDRSGRKRMNNPRMVGEREMEMKKLMAKTNWFRRPKVTHW